MRSEPAQIYKPHRRSVSQRIKKPSGVATQLEGGKEPKSLAHEVIVGKSCILFHRYQGAFRLCREKLEIADRE